MCSPVSNLSLPSVPAGSPGNFFSRPLAFFRSCVFDASVHCSQPFRGVHAHHSCQEGALPSGSQNSIPVGWVRSLAPKPSHLRKTTLHLAAYPTLFYGSLVSIVPRSWWRQQFSMKVPCFYLFCFGAMHGTWDLSSLTRDRPCTDLSGNAES